MIVLLWSILAHFNLVEESDWLTISLYLYLHHPSTLPFLVLEIWPNSPKGDNDSTEI